MCIILNISQTKENDAHTHIFITGLCSSEV